MSLRVGQVRTQRLLGSTATYRVVDVGSEHAVVEVVHAPGLVQGTKLRLTVAAVDRMDEVDEPGDEPSHGTESTRELRPPEAAA